MGCPFTVGQSHQITIFESHEFAIRQSQLCIHIKSLLIMYLAGSNGSTTPIVLSASSACLIHKNSIETVRVIAGSQHLFFLQVLQYLGFSSSRLTQCWSWRRIELDRHVLRHSRPRWSKRYAHVRKCNILILKFSTSSFWIDYINCFVMRSYHSNLIKTQVRIYRSLWTICLLCFQYIIMNINNALQLYISEYFVK